MKKIIADEVVTRKDSEEILKLYLMNTLQGFLEEFCIFNVGEGEVFVRLNGGNYFKLERGEGFETTTPVYKCQVQDKNSVVKFSGIAD